MQDIEELPLVLVYPLYLNVENRVGIDIAPGELFRQARELFLIPALDLVEALPEFWIIGERLYSLELSEILDPPISYIFRYQGGEIGISCKKPPAGRDSIRLVVDPAAYSAAVAAI